MVICGRSKGSSSSENVCTEKYRYKHKMGIIYTEFHGGRWLAMCTDEDPRIETFTITYVLCICYGSIAHRTTTCLFVMQQFTNIVTFVLNMHSNCQPSRCYHNQGIYYYLTDEKTMWLDITLMWCIFPHLQLIKIRPLTCAISSHIAFLPIK